MCQCSLWEDGVESGRPVVGGRRTCVIVWWWWYGVWMKVLCVYVCTFVVKWRNWWEVTVTDVVWNGRRNRYVKVECPRIRYSQDTSEENVNRSKGRHTNKMRKLSIWSVKYRTVGVERKSVGTAWKGHEGVERDELSRKRLGSTDVGVGCFNV